MYNLLSREAHRLLDVRVLCRSRVFDEKFPKTFLCKRRGCSAEGATNGGMPFRQNYRRSSSDSLLTLEYSLSRWILICFYTKLLFIRCPFAPKLTRPTSLFCVLCDKQLASSVYSVIIISKFASVFTGDGDALLSSSSLLSMSLTSAV